MNSAFEPDRNVWSFPVSPAAASIDLEAAFFGTTFLLAERFFFGCLVLGKAAVSFTPDGVVDAPAGVAVPLAGLTSNSLVAVTLIMLSISTATGPFRWLY